MFTKPIKLESQRQPSVHLSTAFLRNKLQMQQGSLQDGKFHAFEITIISHEVRCCQDVA